MDEFTALDKYSSLFSYDEYRQIVRLISSKDVQSKLIKSGPRTRIENMKWNGEAICNRLLSTSASSVPYFINYVETTTFSTNEPILLKSFSFSRLLVHANNTYLYGKDVPSEITIFQLPNPSHPEEDGAKNVFNERINIRSESTTDVELSKLILIKPGLKYVIRMTLSSKGKYCTAVLLQTKVQLGSDIVIQFHKDPTLEDDTTARSTIQYLRFARI